MNITRINRINALLNQMESDRTPRTIEQLTEWHGIGQSTMRGHIRYMRENGMPVVIADYTYARHRPIPMYAYGEGADKPAPGLMNVRTKATQENYRTILKAIEKRPMKIGEIAVFMNVGENTVRGMLKKMKADGMPVRIAEIRRNGRALEYYHGWGYEPDFVYDADKEPLRPVHTLPPDQIKPNPWDAWLFAARKRGTLSAAA